MKDYSRPHAFILVDRHRFYRGPQGRWYWGNRLVHFATLEQMEMIKLELAEKTGKPRFSPTFLRKEMVRNARKKAKRGQAIA